MKTHTNQNTRNPLRSLNILRLSILLIPALLFVACEARQRPSRPSASGRSGEMLVVMKADQWDGPAGKVIQDVFASYEPMLPQAEPRFDLVQIVPDAFVKMFESHRHIFMAEMDPALERATLEVSRDVWAYPQMVIRVKAPDADTFERLMERNAEAFIEHYLSVERERYINAYRRMLNHEARRAVYQQFGVQMDIPEGYFVAVQEEDFIWLRRTATREELDMGILIASLPYTDPARDFHPQTIRARRDSLTRQYIPGQFPGTYMTTYPELPDELREISFNGVYAVEARGLWRVEGDFMGGPYVNYTFVDERSNRLFILDGFVYAPKFDKRDYLRQVKAVIYSLSYPEPETTLEEE